MENYDLRTITHDKLHFLLSTAKDEIDKWTRCREEIENCENVIKKGKKRISQLGKPRTLMINVYSFLILIILFGVWAFYENKEEYLMITFPMLIPIILLFLFRYKSIDIQKEIEKREEELPHLIQKEEEAKNEFKALLFIPHKYRNEYAMTTMFEYVRDKEASNWERVTDLYKKHLHEQKMEGIARKQTELAEDTLNTARWAAAGAWASAAGIWRR